MTEVVLGLFAGVAVLDPVKDEFVPDVELAANAVVVPETAVEQDAVLADTETESVDSAALEDAACAAAQVVASSE